MAAEAIGRRPPDAVVVGFEPTTSDVAEQQFQLAPKQSAFDRLTLLKLTSSNLDRAGDDDGGFGSSDAQRLLFAYELTAGGSNTTRVSIAGGPKWANVVPARILRRTELVDLFGDFLRAGYAIDLDVDGFPVLHKGEEAFKFVRGRRPAGHTASNSNSPVQRRPVAGETNNRTGELVLQRSSSGRNVSLPAAAAAVRRSTVRRRIGRAVDNHKRRGSVRHAVASSNNKGSRVATRRGTRIKRGSSGVGRLMVDLREGGGGGSGSLSSFEPADGPTPRPKWTATSHQDFDSSDELGAALHRFSTDDDDEGECQHLNIVDVDVPTARKENSWASLELQKLPVLKGERNRLASEQWMMTCDTDDLDSPMEEDEAHKIVERSEKSRSSLSRNGELFIRTTKTVRKLLSRSSAGGRLAPISEQAYSSADVTDDDRPQFEPDFEKSSNLFTGKTGSNHELKIKLKRALARITDSEVRRGGSRQERRRELRNKLTEARRDHRSSGRRRCAPPAYSIVSRSIAPDDDQSLKLIGRGILDENEGLIGETRTVGGGNMVSTFGMSGVDEAAGNKPGEQACSSDGQETAREDSDAEKELDDFSLKMDAGLRALSDLKRRLKEIASMGGAAVMSETSNPPSPRDSVTVPRPTRTRRRHDAHQQNRDRITNRKSSEAPRSKLVSALKASRNHRASNDVQRSKNKHSQQIIGVSSSRGLAGDEGGPTSVASIPVAAVTSFDETGTFDTGKVPNDVSPRMSPKSHPAETTSTPTVSKSSTAKLEEENKIRRGNNRIKKHGTSAGSKTPRKDASGGKQADFPIELVCNLSFLFKYDKKYLDQLNECLVKMDIPPIQPEIVEKFLTEMSTNKNIPKTKDLKIKGQIEVWPETGDDTDPKSSSNAATPTSMSINFGGGHHHHQQQQFSSMREDAAEDLTDEKTKQTTIASSSLGDESSRKEQWRTRREELKSMPRAHSPELIDVPSTVDVAKSNSAGSFVAEYTGAASLTGGQYKKRYIPDFAMSQSSRNEDAMKEKASVFLTHTSTGHLHGNRPRMDDAIHDVNLVTSKHIADAFEAAARKKLELMSAVSDETEWPNNNKSRSLADFKSPRDGIESRGGSDDRMGGGPVATLPPAAPHNSTTADAVPAQFETSMYPTERSPTVSPKLQYEDVEEIMKRKEQEFVFGPPGRTSEDAAAADLAAAAGPVFGAHQLHHHQQVYTETEMLEKIGAAQVGATVNPGELFSHPVLIKPQDGINDDGSKPRPSALIASDMPMDGAVSPEVQESAADMVSSRHQLQQRETISPAPEDNDLSAVRMVPPTYYPDPAMTLAVATSTLPLLQEHVVPPAAENDEGGKVDQTAGAAEQTVQPTSLYSGIKNAASALVNRSWTLMGARANHGEVKDSAVLAKLPERHVAKSSPNILTESSVGHSSPKTGKETPTTLQAEAADPAVFKVTHHGIMGYTAYAGPNNVANGGNNAGKKFGDELEARPATAAPGIPSDTSVASSLSRSYDENDPDSVSERVFANPATFQQPVIRKPSMNMMTAAAPRLAQVTTVSTSPSLASMVTSNAPQQAVVAEIGTSPAAANLDNFDRKIKLSKKENLIVMCGGDVIFDVKNAKEKFFITLYSKSGPNRFVSHAISIDKKEGKVGVDCSVRDGSTSENNPFSTVADAAVSNRSSATHVAPDL